MKTDHRKSFFFRRRGSTIGVILVFTISLGIVIASSFNYAMTESRLNQSDLLANEARLAAESVLEHGMAQLRRRFDRTHQLTALEMRPDRSTALRLENDFLNFLQHRSGSRVVAPPGLGNSAWPNHQSFVSRPISLGAVVLNQGDPVTLDVNTGTMLPEEGMAQFEQSARVREVRVYARARVDGGRWGNRDAYARKTFQVLDESLYQFAVYFADVLELWPGPDMNLAEGGPVYGREVWFGANSRLNVHGRVIAPDGFFIDRHPDSGRTESPSNNIYLRDLRAGDDSGDYLIRLTDANPHGGHLDSRHTEFRELALQNYRGGLVTGAHGVNPQSPVGLEAIREMSENAEEPSFNPAHHLIQPPRDEAFFQEITDETERELFRTIEESKWSTQSEIILDASNVHTGGEVVLRDRAGNEIELEADQIFWEVEEYSIEDGSVTSGLYDYRQARNNSNDSRGRINLLRLDMGIMDEWVGSPDPIPWNGGVYVHMPEVPDPVRDDHVIPANGNWAVQLHNAAVLPNRHGVETDATSGLTLATNAALYVQGNFNAPNGGGTSTEPEENFGERGAEAPAALVADAVTLLSNNWDNANSHSTSLSGDRRATSTVVSAAIISGNVASADRNYSGGLENFPRFLEAWSGRTLTYRGSMINLYRSEAFDGPWRFGGNVYNAPNRDWGFNRGFRDLTPPLDPGTRVFRQVNFLELSRERFVKETKALYDVD